MGIGRTSQGAKSIRVKWIYKTKLNKDGNLDKYKVRLVVKGYKQELGVDHKEKKYVLEILDKFKMKDCNSVCNPTEYGLKLMKDGGKKINATLYKQIIGSLMHLTSTRPDMYGVSLISRYMENPIENHLSAAKSFFRYLKGTVDFGIFYAAGTKGNLIGFSDSDFAGDLNDRKSTSGFVFLMSCGAVSWSSKTTNCYLIEY
ncbi:hypothetical protein GH714_031724 [Hevea brasiliensis]|uniref:Reverse transcriptase Ty1/copia-type domain-containing protein n=1 Tax=Hevea brasiliensis TaxID=3981 RepID=A0A6A6L1D4_HEVBR|nr:hypothetical protein GH714_031724 [Hevea brasiliensis]